MNIADVIEGLEQAERMGAEEDIPEGSRYIQISETLLLQIIETLKRELVMQEPARR